jgi:hypothetical protein
MIRKKKHMPISEVYPELEVFEAAAAQMSSTAPYWRHSDKHCCGSIAARAAPEHLEFCPFTGTRTIFRAELAPDKIESRVLKALSVGCHMRFLRCFFLGFSIKKSINFSSRITEIKMASTIDMTLFKTRALKGGLMAATIIAFDSLGVNGAIVRMADRIVPSGWQGWAGTFIAVMIASFTYDYLLDERVMAWYNSA